jgi:anhydro-N-acetylmuramic acid kinase
MLKTAQTAAPRYFIGLMSGTSMDGIDAALVRIDEQSCQLVDYCEHPLSESIRNDILALCQPGNNEIDRMGALSYRLGEQFAAAALKLSKRNNVHIEAIGSHGQTIRHRPDGSTPFTLQIGNPALIAELCGITTVADFRSRDIAAGGQGAPLAPAFHRHAFAASDKIRAIVNIGGMSNVTVLDGNQLKTGFDTGPGNVLMDAWTALHQQQSYDQDGRWAASGKVVPRLLGELLALPYFQLPAPKSTGREQFNLQWLESFNTSGYSTEDIQATLLELTAVSISDAINQQGHIQEVFVCGGGAYNKTLINRLQTLQQSRPVNTTANLGIAPEWVEAAAFAWLAHRAIDKQTGNSLAVTGAAGERVLGAIYPA